MKKKLTSLALVGAFLGLSWYGNVQAQESSGNKIHFINVQEGGSDAIILESNGHFAMVDTGEDYDFPDGSDSRYPWREGIETSYKHVLTDRVFRRLKELGVQKLDFILVTHTHSDHIGNVDELLSTYPVDRVYLKKYSDNRITNSERLWDNLYGYDKVLQTASEKGVSVIQNITQGDAHFQFGDMDIQLYNYENETDSSGELKKIWDDNSNSLISVVKVNGKKIYLGGDLDNVHGAEDKYGPLIGKVDLMKFNHHHDTNKSNTKDFIKNLSPSLIVQTSDSLPWKNGVDSEYVNWLKERGIERINAASKDYDATVFDIRQDGLVNFSTS
ncbi:choline binding protein E CbpE [Streptococcus pneumoniae]|nr:choline binding protein E CbpE [Streptococcus pneumoniae]